MPDNLKILYKKSEGVIKEQERQREGLIKDPRFLRTSLHRRVYPQPLADHKGSALVFFC